MEEKDFKDFKSQILTRKQMMSLFEISNVTLTKWGNMGFVRPHKIERSVYYLKDEVIEDLRSNGKTLRKNHRQLKEV